MMKVGHGQTSLLHDINLCALNHTSRAPQLLSCNCYISTNLQMQHMHSQSNEMSGVIECQLSNFPNNCVTSSLLQEELLFLCLARKISLQQVTKTTCMFLCLYVRFLEV